MHAKTTSSATPEYQEFLVAEFSHLGSKQLPVFSFFSGGGGADLVIEATGFPTKLCFDTFKEYLNTLNTNLPHTNAHRWRRGNGSKKASCR